MSKLLVRIATGFVAIMIFISSFVYAWYDVSWVVVGVVSGLLLAFTLLFTVLTVNGRERCL